MEVSSGTTGCGVRGMRYNGTAIIVPAVLFKDERLTLSPTNDYLVAGIISVFVAWRSKNLLLTIIIGMLVFLSWRWVLSTHVLGL